MLQLKIDSEKCVSCGECVKDCAVRVLTMTDEGVPGVVASRAEQCMRCQHCLAICPTGALSILGVDPKDCAPLKSFPDAEQMEMLLRGRRSVRRYKKENVDRSAIRHLVDVASNAPSGKNFMGIQYTVVDDMETMDKVRDRTAQEIRARFKRGPVEKKEEMFKTMASLWLDKGVDLLYRGAPHMVVASAPASNPTPEADCMIGLSYFELLAASMGLGTLWDGFALWAYTSVASQMPGILGVPEDHKVGYVMLFGKPAVRYHRIVDRTNDAMHTVAL